MSMGNTEQKQSLLFFKTQVQVTLIMSWYYRDNHRSYWPATFQEKSDTERRKGRELNHQTAYEYCKTYIQTQVIYKSNQ